jgi:hypothetical protein
VLNSDPATIEVEAIHMAADVNIGGEQLVTRVLGRRFGARLEQVLSSASERRLVLSFAGVQLMDGSFADEALASLAARRSRQVTRLGQLVLKNLDPTSRDNLELAMTSRPVREAGLRNCVLPMMKSPSQIELIGKAEDHVRRSFELLMRKHELTARELADEEAIDIGAASTRLKVLLNLGLAGRREERQERGRQYVYRSVG